MERLSGIDALRSLREGLSSRTKTQERLRARACCGPACSAAGAHRLTDALAEEARSRGMDLDIVRTGCHGMCWSGPNIKMEPSNYYFQKVTVPVIPLVLSAATPHDSVEGYERADAVSFERRVARMSEIPFYKKQLRIALRNSARIDPTDITQYITVGGYMALAKALTSMTPEQVLSEVDKANLRGRGGAGFPAGIKWRHAKKAKAKVKFVIANGDEGDPGAFMDRAIMEGDPHSLLEGMMLCAYAMGAQFGLIYVRHEYPRAVKHISIAIRQAEEIGLLGDRILGSGFSFHLGIREGAGAYVCGESTSLVASIEGERGFPRPRPPRLSEVGGGVWGYPSNLNNIETYACVPPIVENGYEWFRGIGTPTSPGTKVFSLTGKVVHTGLVEVPMGTTLRTIIYDIGGGIASGKRFKAAQTGGPSGGCIPERYLDLPVDFDSLKKIGSTMGSGGMVVMDEDTCMVDVARYFLSFTQAESCGKCPPCRIGTYQMLKILDRISAGEGLPEDIARLISLGKMIKRGSLCGLGQSAPNPVLSTIRYFREEYEEHIHDQYCRAGVCRGTGVYIINQKECIRCGLCKKACAYDAVLKGKDKYFIDRDYCARCRACYLVCPVHAIRIRKRSQVRLQEQFRLPEAQQEAFERRSAMTLKDIIESKPREMVYCCPTCKVTDAIRHMKEKNVGSILVLDDKKKLVGIFTERDLMDCIVKNVSLQDVTMESVMTRDPITLDSSIDLGVAMSLMSDRKIRHLPVTDDEQITGVISYRDLVSFLLPEVFFMADDVYRGDA